MPESLNPSERSAAQTRVFGVLFAVAGALFLWTLSPVWVPVFLGVLLTIAVAPTYARVTRRWPRHPRLLAAGLTALTMGLVVTVFGYVAYVAVRELAGFLQRALIEWHAHGADSLFAGHRGAFCRRVGLTPERVNASIHQAATSALGDLSAILSRLLDFASRGFLTMLFTSFTAYYLLIDGRRLLDWAVGIVPLPNEQTRELVREFHDVSRALLLGTGATALYQAVAAGLGFFIFRIPSPIVWGTLAGVAALVPAVGSALVWVPVAIAAALLGHVGRGVGVALWGGFLVSAVSDYVIRPLIIGSRVRLHNLLVFISVFGGLEAFGPLGVVLGPLFVALFVATVRIYSRAYRPGLVVPPTM